MLNLQQIAHHYGKWSSFAHECSSPYAPVRYKSPSPQVAPPVLPSCLIRRNFEHPCGAKFFQGTHDLKTPRNHPQRKYWGHPNTWGTTKDGIAWQVVRDGIYPLKPKDSSTQMEAFVFGIPYKSKKKCQNPGMVTFTYCVGWVDPGVDPNYPS